MSKRHEKKNQAKQRKENAKLRGEKFRKDPSIYIQSQETGDCPLCNRLLVRPSDHHLIPRSRGGVETLPICEDCHRAIHARFTVKELEADYYTVESLLTDEEFSRTVRFISKQDPHTKIHTATSHQKRNSRGKYMGP